MISETKNQSKVDFVSHDCTIKLYSDFINDHELNVPHFGGGAPLSTSSPAVFSSSHFHPLLHICFSSRSIPVFSPRIVTCGFHELTHSSFFLCFILFSVTPSVWICSDSQKAETSLGAFSQAQNTHTVFYFFYFWPFHFVSPSSDAPLIIILFFVCFHLSICLWFIKHDNSRVSAVLSENSHVCLGLRLYCYFNSLWFPTPTCSHPKLQES